MSVATTMITTAHARVDERGVPVGMGGNRRLVALAAAEQHQRIAPHAASTAATTLPSTDRGSYPLDVGRERAILTQPLRQRAHVCAGCRHPATGLERRQELDRLRPRQQLDRERSLRVREHLHAT